ncbi:unnamed protein product [Lota lota]
MPPLCCVTHTDPIGEEGESSQILLVGKGNHHRSYWWGRGIITDPIGGEGESSRVQTGKADKGKNGLILFVEVKLHGYHDLALGLKCKGARHDTLCVACERC